MLGKNCTGGSFLALAAGRASNVGGLVCNDVATLQTLVFILGIDAQTKHPSPTTDHVKPTITITPHHQ